MKWFRLIFTLKTHRTVPFIDLSQLKLIAPSIGSRKPISINHYNVDSARAIHHIQSDSSMILNLERGITSCAIGFDISIHDLLSSTDTALISFPSIHLMDTLLQPSQLLYVRSSRLRYAPMLTN